MANSYDVIADDAMKRRREKNTPWPSPKVEDVKVHPTGYDPNCLGCGSKELSKISCTMCDACIKRAYLALDSMEK